VSRMTDLVANSQNDVTFVDLTVGNIVQVLPNDARRFSVAFFVQNVPATVYPGVGERNIDDGIMIELGRPTLFKLDDYGPLPTGAWYAGDTKVNVRLFIITTILLKE
jgi:hypothetical protein